MDLLMTGLRGDARGKAWLESDTAAYFTVCKLKIKLKNKGERNISYDWLDFQLVLFQQSDWYVSMGSSLTHRCNRLQKAIFWL